MRTRIGYINATALMLAAVLFGFAVITSTPSSLVQHTRELFAAVGVTIAVAPNPYNTVAQQLSAKETQLTQREAQLSAQEDATARSQTTSSDRYGFYSVCMSSVLVVLVGLNFYFDIRRRSREPRSAYSVDLR